MIKTNIQVQKKMNPITYLIQGHIRLFLMEKFEAFGFIETLILALPKIKESPMVQEKRSKYLILLFENISYLMQIKTKSLVDIFYFNPNKEIGRNFISNLVEILLIEDEGVQVQVLYFIS